MFDDYVQPACVSPHLQENLAGEKLKYMFKFYCVILNFGGVPITFSSIVVKLVDQFLH